MITIQEHQERIKELAGEIAFNLSEDVLFKQLILEEDIEKEIDIYCTEEEISYNELNAKTREQLINEGYNIVNTTEYTIRMGAIIAADIEATTETYRISREEIEDKLDTYDYPDIIDSQDIIDETVEKLINLDYTVTDYKELVTPFEYHCTPNPIIAPYNENKNKNIKGLELEISDDDLSIENELAELAKEYTIATPDNWNNQFEETPNIALEEDGSVKYELIFRAQTNDKLLEEIEKIKYLEEIVDNHTGTSAHIHINRRYIENKLGLTETDITKAAEFLNYPLFLISGRKKETAHEWARSQLPCPIEANLATKAKHVDKLNKVNYAKYNFINCSPEDTIELRIFSNKCNFNKYVIEMYLETVDFIIELAEYMKNKSYTKELKNIIPLCKNHFEKFGYTLDFYNTKKQIMDEFKEPKKLLKKAIKNEWITIDNHIASFLNYAQIEPTSYDTIRRFISIIRTLNREHECNYDFYINPEITDVQKLAKEIRIDIEKTYKAKMEAI